MRRSSSRSTASAWSGPGSSSTSTPTRPPPPARDRILPDIPIGDHIDLTGLANGFHTLAVLAALRGQQSPADDASTLRVHTPSGGLHVWYRATDNRPWRSSAGSSPGRALAWQVDIRAHGSYIIAPAPPPSRAPTRPSTTSANRPLSRCGWRRNSTAPDTCRPPISPRPARCRPAPSKPSSPPAAAAGSAPWPPSSLPSRPAAKSPRAPASPTPSTAPPTPSAASSRPTGSTARSPNRLCGRPRPPPVRDRSCASSRSSAVVSPQASTSPHGTGRRP
ncbi:bifunctional DNA primase/polymerase [Streptomyces canus]|uniref:bifunctional DNA primase/polymerase n=1 Tax=Streptomyces canus TaxID=58343 RepID=UPI00386C1F16